MKVANEDWEELLQSLRHCKARFISFRNGPVFDLSRWQEEQKEQAQKK